MVDLSIIIPTYNRGHFLSSVVELCSHTLGGIDLQTIVIDDASSDNTQQVLDSFSRPIESFRLEKNSGPAAARNAGLEKATGRYVKFLDSDDVLEPGSLQAEFEVAERSRADIVVSGWGTVQLDESGVPLEETRRTFRAPEFRSIPDDILQGKAVPTSAALYRRDYIQDVRWDGRVKRPDDWLFFCCAALQQGVIVTHEGVSYWLQGHGGRRVNSGDLLSYAYDHHYILGVIEDILISRGLLTQARMRELAQYYYKQLRVLAIHDRTAFDRAASHIRELDPRFVPEREEPRRSLRWLARRVGFRNAALFYARMKKLRDARASLGRTSS